MDSREQFEAKWRRGGCSACARAKSVGERCQERIAVAQASRDAAIEECAVLIAKFEWTGSTTAALRALKGKE
jgi:hypothetical protein